MVYVLIAPPVGVYYNSIIIIIIIIIIIYIYMYVTANSSVWALLRLAPIIYTS